MIMSSLRFRAALKPARQARRWSQEELAARAGVSRAEVSAVETGRSVPSTAVALALARALGRSVEELFRLADPAAEPAWAWQPAAGRRRFWSAEAYGQTLRYPVEATALGALAHDGVATESAAAVSPGAAPERTLVVAGCDPAVGILAEALRPAGVRVLPFVRASRRALELLRERRVHVAGIHLAETSAGNARAARRLAGEELAVVHVARWREGVALTPGTGIASAARAARAGLRWIGREEGSGARACQDELLAGRALPPGVDHTASDHRGVVEAIRSGWAQAGVCVQLAAEEGGLDFLPVRAEAYDFCYPPELERDPRIEVLVATLAAAPFRRLMSELPGYDARRAGALA
jgi:molybdate-binding protein/transcriptional regulator with XRE-family HTH domain